MSIQEKRAVMYSFVKYASDCDHSAMSICGISLDEDRVGSEIFFYTEEDALEWERSKPLRPGYILKRFTDAELTQYVFWKTHHCYEAGLSGHVYAWRTDYGFTQDDDSGSIKVDKIPLNQLIGLLRDQASSEQSQCGE